MCPGDSCRFYGREVARIARAERRWGVSNPCLAVVPYAIWNNFDYGIWFALQNGAILCFRKDRGPEVIPPDQVETADVMIQDMEINDGALAIVWGCDPTRKSAGHLAAVLSDADVMRAWKNIDCMIAVMGADKVEGRDGVVSCQLPIIATINRKA